MFNLDVLRDIARKIHHCDDRGILFWHPYRQEVFWMSADSDFGDDGANGQYNDDCEFDPSLPPYTQEAEVRNMFMAVPFVKAFSTESEGYPEDYDEDEKYNNISDWIELKY